MDIKDFYARMRKEVSEYSKSRTESSGFLVWFLENFFRLETQTAIDSVCDKQNDKGIDGIFVDDEDEEIFIFQSKYSPKNNMKQGDNDIRNFIGAREWFVDETSIHKLVESSASQELKSLVERYKIADKINYSKTSVFVTNKIFNTDATEYIDAVNNLGVYDVNSLYEKYTYFAEDQNIFPSIDLYLDNASRIEYTFPDGINARVYSIRAKELLKLQGIQDRTLFYKNVRYGVGNTRVNKSIQNTILDSDEHRNFFLYHNGITILCENLDEHLDKNKISISSYAVINGCQSMLTFFENKDKLTNNIFISVKIIQTELTSHLVENISYFANNQNSISLQDLRSNTSVQRALAAEFKELFSGTVLYRRKKGENEDGYYEIIPKDFAAQLYLAVYLKEPHNTHLKNSMFGKNYSTIFSRKISAEKIYLAKIIYDVVKQNASLLANEQVQDYSLSLFFFAYSISEILRKDEMGKIILDTPKTYITINKELLKESLTSLWSLMTPGIDFEIDEYTKQNDNFFDYKNLFRNSAFVESMSGLIIKDYIKSIRRNTGDAFSEIYKKLHEKTKE